MTNPAEWNKDIAVEIAKEEGIATLTPAHWKVIDYCRDASNKLGGKSPTLRQITTGTGVQTKELFAPVPQGAGEEGCPRSRAWASRKAVFDSAG